LKNNTENTACVETMIVETMMPPAGLSADAPEAAYQPAGVFTDADAKEMDI